MSEKASNREMFERIAKELMQMKSQKEIDAFVNMMVFSFVGLT